MNISPMAKIYSVLSARAAGQTGRGDGDSLSAASGAKSSDTVSISDAASGMSNLKSKLNLASLLGFETETPGTVTIDELESHGLDSLNQFNTTVCGYLSSEGVDTSKPIQLDVASDGSIVVTNDHPDKTAIESYLKQNPDLANEYRRINNLLTIAKEAKEASAFQQAYRTDPKAALAKFDYLFKTDTKTTISISDRGADVTYTATPMGSA